MQRVVAAAALLVCGCRFHLDALPGGSVAGDDLAVNGSVDLASADGDLATTTGGDDLAMTSGGGADMVADPCANPPPLGAGNLAARCVVGAPPMLDGNLSEWPASSFVPITHSNAAISSGSWQDDPAVDDPDSSARMAWAWDYSYFYVAVAVTDNARATPSPQLYNDDSVEFYFDGQHDRTIAYGSDDWQLIYCVDGRTAAYQTSASVTFPSGTKQALTSGPGADWSIEVAIPWSLLGGTPAALGRLVGYDFQLDDNDGTTNATHTLDAYYMPGPGGGACSAPYCRTDAFATVQLQGR